MAKTKVTKPVESGFLSGAFTRFLAGDSKLPNPTPEFDQKSAERYFLPAKVNRLKTELEALKNQNKLGAKGLRLTKHCQLWEYVAQAKRANPRRASDQAWIASRVDLYLDKNAKELKDVCLDSWLKVRKPPLSLVAALQHPILKPRVKTFISKARY